LTLQSRTYGGVAPCALDYRIKSGNDEVCVPYF